VVGEGGAKNHSKIVKFTFRTEEFLLLLSLCHGLSYAYALPSTIASNHFFSKTTTPTNFIFCTHVAWVSAYKFCASNANRAHSVPKKAFPLTIFSRTKSGAEKLNTVFDS
jgi:hypothetical protein